jgi:hypothetical protein
MWWCHREFRRDDAEYASNDHDNHVGRRGAAHHVRDSDREVG